MKKCYICIVFLALFFTSCQTNQPSTPSSTTDTYTESSSAVIWFEESKTVVDEWGSHRTGVHYKEIDLAELTWDGRTWDELGPGIEPCSDLSQILGRSIATRDEAARIAIKIMESEQKTENRAFVDAIGLSQVAYDLNRSIWIISYWQDRPGSALSIAIDGKSDELIRIWSYGE